MTSNKIPADADDIVCIRKKSIQVGKDCTIALFAIATGLMLGALLFRVQLHKTILAVINALVAVVVAIVSAFTSLHIVIQAILMIVVIGVPLVVLYAWAWCEQRKFNGHDLNPNNGDIAFELWILFAAVDFIVFLGSLCFTTWQGWLVVSVLTIYVLYETFVKNTPFSFLQAYINYRKRMANPNPVANAIVDATTIDATTSIESTDNKWED